MKDLSARAAKYERTIDFGLRVHVIVRETEEEARAYTKRLMSKFNAAEGLKLKNRTQDAQSVGVVRQNELRAQADDDGFVEPLLWTEIGKARSGCGGALVGNPDQVLKKINRYMDMGIRSFIFSGYPLIEECRLFAKHALRNIPQISMPIVQKRMPSETPVTPLTNGVLK
ncbi:MAG: LLM class flavin-dependent oxidoreductase [Pyrinomonadaceae bacterium]